MERIAVASDHGGYHLKRIIVELLRESGYEVDDLGTDSPEAVDYPDFAHEIANKIAYEEVQRAILVCGTGIGMSITANRYPNVRAALCNDVYSAKMSRLHNNANVLVLGGRVLGQGLASDIVTTWMETEFEGGRHERRINKIENTNLENIIHKTVASHLKGNGTVDEETVEKIVKETIEKLTAKNSAENKKEK